MGQNILLVGLGGAFGSIFRHYFSIFFSLYFSFQQYWATFFVNILGSFVLGLLFNLIEKNILHNDFKFLLMIGFCGGFTTFSALSLDNYKFLVQGQIVQSFLYSFGTIILGLLALYFGVYVGKIFS